MEQQVTPGNDPEGERLDWWFYQQVGSSEMRKDAFAGLRLKRIVDVLGAEEAQPIWDSALKEFEASVDTEVWKKYLRRYAIKVSSKPCDRASAGWNTALKASRLRCSSDANQVDTDITRYRLASVGRSGMVSQVRDGDYTFPIDEKF